MLKYIIILCISCTTVFSQTIYDFAKKGDIQAIEALAIEDERVYNSQNENGYTPLMLAAYYNKIDMISYLLSKKAIINAVSSYGTALMAAAVKGHKEAVLILLKEGADPNISDKNKSTALQFTALFGHTEIAEALLKYGADVHIKDFRGNKALDYAIMKQNEILIKLLNTYQ
jgi:ankyrin repeat protein